MKKQLALAVHFVFRPNNKGSIPTRCEPWVAMPILFPHVGFRINFFKWSRARRTRAKALQTTPYKRPKLGGFG